MPENWREQVLERYGEEWALRQLAEECCELAQAALKVVRAENGETLVMSEEATEHMIEEMADVEVMLGFIADLLSGPDLAKLHMIKENKEKRIIRVCARKGEVTQG